MKLETYQDLAFVLAVFVPGFVYNEVILRFVPLRLNNQKEFALLRFVTSTAIIFALVSPLIYAIQLGGASQWPWYSRGIAWFGIIFIAPAIVGVIRAWFIQHEGFRWLYKLLRLRAISPIPTGWDVYFGRTLPCFVLITLTDGTEIAGYFGPLSAAASDPEHRDIYIEKVYTIEDGDKPWVPVTDSAGMHIDGAQIAYMEFRSIPGE